MTTSCVNPLHLIEGDAGVNAWDRSAKSRGGILQACSPPDPSSDEKHEAEVTAFLRLLRSMADEWQKSKALTATLALAEACIEVRDVGECTQYRRESAVPTGDTFASLVGLQEAAGFSN